jgi:hypothetical protein
MFPLQIKPLLVKVWVGGAKSVDTVEMTLNSKEEIS